jgi:SAM-dependent methyltransferase
MAVLKIYRHVQRFGLRSTLRKVLSELPAYLTGIRFWQIRRCRCCERFSVFVCNGPAAEFRACLFCSANERYELLAQEIKTRYGSALQQMRVLELDPHSPLARVLSSARAHVRTYFVAGEERGKRRADGSLCQDITALTFPDQSFDLIVSSDVLEHVPALERAFSESRRVLKPGKAHLFTVPPRPKTRKRAAIIAGQLIHFAPPEHHHDPLSPSGILAFWDVGPDLADVVDPGGLRVSVVRGPCGPDKRVVWMAERS